MVARRVKMPSRASRRASLEDFRRLAEIVGRINVDVLADRMVSEYLNQIPGYRRSGSAAARDQAVASARTNIVVFVHALAEAREPLDAELNPARQAARARAREGVPLEQVLQAYRIAGLLGLEMAREVAPPDEYAAAQVIGSELYMRYLDRLSAAVTDAYLQESGGVHSDPGGDDGALIEAMVEQRPAAEIRELAGLRGVAVQDRYRAFVAELLSGVPGKLAARLRSHGALAAVEGKRVIALVGPDSVLPPLGPNALYALGAPVELCGIASALDDARMLVGLGRQAGRTGEITARELLLEYLLLRSPDLASALRDRAFGALERYAERRNGLLLETVEACVTGRLHFERASLARRLHVHPNTIDHRLARIKELTGLDLARSDDLVLAALALKQRELTDNAAEGEEGPADR